MQILLPDGTPRPEAALLLEKIRASIFRRAYGEEQAMKRAHKYLRIGQ